MGRIVVTEFVSLDGVVEAPGGGEGFKHDGWSFEIDRGDEGNQFKLEETMSSEALLLGRKTYEGFAAAWPSRDGEFAEKFNSMPKYVVSSTLEDPEWNNTTVLDGVHPGRQQCVDALANCRGILPRAQTQVDPRQSPDALERPLRGGDVHECERLAQRVVEREDCDDLQ